MKANYSDVANDQLIKVESALRQIRRLKQHWSYTEYLPTCNAAIFALEVARNELRNVQRHFAGEFPELERKR